jgi:peptide deformylase
LEGLVFLDRVENNHDLISEEEYQKSVMGNW